MSWGGQIYEVSCSNTVEVNELKQFLRSLRQRWLGLPQEIPAGGPAAYGGGLDAKFTVQLQEELDSGEEVRTQYFDSSQVLSHRRWFCRKPSWTPSHLLAVTSARRLLWITDQYSRYRDRTASIGRSIPWACISALDIADVGGDRTLQIRFGAAGCWNVPIRQSADSSIEDFAAALISCLS